MRFALGHAFHLRHLFENFNLKKLKINCKDCQDIMGYTRHRDVLAIQIFKDSVKLVINDIIDNNVTFEFPNSLAQIYMEKTQGEDFVRARQNGKWMDVDFIASFFTGYQLNLKLKNRNGAPRRKIPIYVDKNLKNKITENTNNGKQYY